MKSNIKKKQGNSTFIKFFGEGREFLVLTEEFLNPSIGNFYIRGSFYYEDIGLKTRPYLRIKPHPWNEVQHLEEVQHFNTLQIKKKNV